MASIDDPAVIGIVGIAFGWLLPHILGLFGWAGQRHIERIDDMEDDFSKRIALLERDSIGRPEFERAVSKIFDALTKNNEKIHEIAVLLARDDR